MKAIEKTQSEGRRLVKCSGSHAVPAGMLGDAAFTHNKKQRQEVIQEENRTK